MTTLVSRSERKLYKYFIFIFIVLILVVYITTSFYPTFKTDDDVSIGLVTHNYVNLIGIDSTDVHPPLYYLILKLFLQVTTFWTNSMFIKVIFARLFSAILLLLSIFVMGLIAKECGIPIDWKCQLILYLLVPGIINKFVKIRMYSISSLFLALELYELIKFTKNNKYLNLLFVILCVSASSYCFYPVAVSAGFLLIIYFIYDLFCKNKQWIKLFISGIISILMYVPWMRVVVNQFIEHSKNNIGSSNSNYFVSVISSFTQIIFPPSLNESKYIFILVSFISVVVLLLIFLFTILFFRNIQINRIPIFVLFDFVMTIILLFLVCGRNYQSTSVYPVYSIYMFFLIALLVKKLDDLQLYKIVFILLSIFSLYAAGGSYINIKEYDLPSIYLVQNFHYWRSLKNKTIDVNTHNSLKAIQDSLYLKSIHKNVKVYGVNKYDLSQNVFNDSNYKPVKQLFNNMKIN